MRTRGSVRGSGGNHDGYKQRTHQDETKQPRPPLSCHYRRPPLQYVCVSEQRLRIAGGYELVPTNPESITQAGERSSRGTP